LYFANLISGAVAIILLILAGVFILTSFMSFCPLYYMELQKVQSIFLCRKLKEEWMN
jgi:hypothetical protein